MKGREIRVDLVEVAESKLSDGAYLAMVCADAAVAAGASVAGKAWANLGDGDGTPPGCTVAILLNESHITLHTYSKEGLAALNIFTCGKSANPDIAMKAILASLGGRVVFQDSQYRFAGPEDVEW